MAYPSIAYRLTAIDWRNCLRLKQKKREADGGDGQELGPDGLEPGTAEDDGLREARRSAVRGGAA